MVDWDALDLFALGRTLIARIGKHIHLFTLSERAGLRHVFDVGRRTDHGVNQARIGIDADVALHPEVPCMDAPGLPSFQFTTVRRYRLQSCIRTLCRPSLRSLMEFAGWFPITGVHSRCGALLGFDQPRSDLSCHHVVIA